MSKNDPLLDTYSYFAAQGESIPEWSTREDLAETRQKAGMGDVPLLLLYVIDKDSKPRTKSKERTALNTAQDIAALAIRIPGEKRGTTFADTLSVPVQRLKWMDSADLEGTDED
jgi:hypothetical protein